MAILAIVALEVWRVIAFYSSVTTGKDALEAMKSKVALDTLRASPSDIEDLRVQLSTASSRLKGARSFVRTDPVLRLAGLLPAVGNDAKALRAMVIAAGQSADTGLVALQVIQDYNQAQNTPGETSIQSAVHFLQNERPLMARVSSGLDSMKEQRAGMGGSLLGPLASARADLDDALGRLDSLVTGYDHAVTFLPPILGFDKPKQYLILPENDTELFPSGGLISNYGIATFSEGRLTDMQFEYFVNLFDRWQSRSGGEYVEPPAPLKNYLLRNVSWGLGEAGWYPDFPTTARLATSFVQKGGAPPTDGTIALDLQFVEALLKLLGPTTIADYGVTVSVDNLSETTLQETRAEGSLPGAVGKSFLSAVAREMLQKVFAAPRDKWVDLLRVLDRMGRERHLQMFFTDSELQSLSVDYGLSGTLLKPDDDFLMVADTSVNSTKLNLILQPSIEASVQLGMDGSATTRVKYQVTNPLPEWSKGRDPAVVKALMLGGVYGSYLRVYTRGAARLQDVSLNGTSVGPEQDDFEIGNTRVFGRFFRVLPGATQTAEFSYLTPRLVTFDGKTGSYKLQVQKEPGTRSIQLKLNLSFPDGATRRHVTLDGQDVAASGTITTDLSTDRTIEVEFTTE